MTSSNNKINNSTLKYYREKKGLSQKLLAEGIGVGKDTVYKWEKGTQTVRLTNQNKIAKVLGIPLTRLQKEIIEDNSSQHGSDSKIKIEISKSTKVALDIVSETYHINPNLLLDFAPYLFHIVAAASLGEREQKVNEVEAAISSTIELSESLLPHKSIGLIYEDEYFEEWEAIKNNQLFDLEDNENLDTVSGNPFSMFLQAFIKMMPKKLSEVFEAEWKKDQLPGYHISDSFIRSLIRIPVPQDLFEQIKELILNGQIETTYIQNQYRYSDKFIEKHRNDIVKEIVKEIKKDISEKFKEYQASKQKKSGEEL